MTSPHPSVALEFESVRKAFGGVVRVHDVSLVVPSGCVFGILGPNGAGKTTLVRMALDIIRPDAGSVKLLGQSMSRAAVDRVSYLPEERGIYSRASVERVLEYFAEIRGIPRADARRRTHAWLDRMQLSHLRTRTIASLSKGTAQRVQLAAALMHEPELAVLDEPFSGLDPVNVSEVRALIDERRVRGLSTVLSTHLMGEVESICDRVAFIADGRVLAVDTPASMREQVSGPGVRVTTRSDERLTTAHGTERGRVLVVQSTAHVVRGALPGTSSSDVQLSVGVEPEAYLQFLIQSSVPVVEFSPYRLTMNEVFVHLARQGRGADDRFEVDSTGGAR